MSNDTEIRPFRVDMPDEAIADLRQRIAATRWPARELVAEGRRIVQQQKGLIVRLRAAGVDTWEAERTLRLFEANLRRFEEHQDVLKGRT